jgi:hypothetical protein
MYIRRLLLSRKGSFSCLSVPMCENEYVNIFQTSRLGGLYFGSEAQGFGCLHVHHLCCLSFSVQLRLAPSYKYDAHSADQTTRPD